MRKREILIPWEGEILEVWGYYSPAIVASVDRIQPPEDASFEIDMVIYKGVDIVNIIPVSMEESIEQKCLTQIENK